MFFGTARIWQMTDEVAVQLVNVDTPKIVKFLALKAKHLVTCDHGDMDAFAIQYVAIHDPPPMHGRPRRKGCACCPAIARQIARYFPFTFSPPHLDFVGIVALAQFSHTARNDIE
jgi:hypothetical protein